MIIAGVVFVVVSIISVGVGISLAKKDGRNDRETRIRNDKYSRPTSVRETPMEITTLSTGEQKSIKYIYSILYQNSESNSIKCLKNSLILTTIL